jgi:hypothetical protein
MPADAFDACFECGTVAHSILRLRCADCGHDKAGEAGASGGVHGPVTRHLLGQTGLKADEANVGGSDAVTLIHCFGQIANLNICLH